MGEIIPIVLPTSDLVGNDCPNCVPGETPRYIVVQITNGLDPEPDGYYLVPQSYVPCVWWLQTHIWGYTFSIIVYQQKTRLQIAVEFDGTIDYYGYIYAFTRCCECPPTPVHHATIQIFEVW